MFLNCLKRRRRVTRDALARRFWDFCGGVSEQFCTDFRVALVMMGRELSHDQQIELSREVTIISLWAISNILRGDRDVLDSLHRMAVSECGNKRERHERGIEVPVLTQDELLKRYRQYYAVWDFSSGGPPPFTLASMMLDNMLNQGQASSESLDIMLMYLVNAHMLDTMTAVAELRRGFDIVD